MKAVVLGVNSINSGIGAQSKLRINCSNLYLEKLRTTEEFGSKRKLGSAHMMRAVNAMRPAQIRQ